MLNCKNRRITVVTLAYLVATIFTLLPPMSPSAFADDLAANGPKPEKLDAADTIAMGRLPYPSEVSVIHRRAGWLFRASPSNLRLYVYDRDIPEKSACTGSCSSDWPPLRPGDDTKPLGDWTIFSRDDGSKQWAYKGHQVYLHSSDSVSKATGDGIDGAWHFLKP